MPNVRQHLVVLGLDGVPLDLARALAATGRFPQLARLLAWHATTLPSERPAVSAVNLASLLTAASPGRHGVFGATHVDPAAYALVPACASALRVPSLIDRLAEAGLTGAYVLPPGFATAGLPPDAAPAGFAASAPDQGAGDGAALLRELRASLASRRAALDELPAKADRDLLLVILPETDRLFRAFFPAVLQPEHDLHAVVLDVLADWDRTIGCVLDRYDALPEPKRCLALAGNGFAPLVTEVDLNAWLSAVGLLTTAPDPENPGKVRIMPHQTAAFALDDGRIHINVKERFARGVFHEHVAAKLAGELREALLALAYEGQPVMEAVHLAEECYEGPLPRNAPDLVCVARPGLLLTGRLDRTEVFGRYEDSGCPSPHGALYCDSAGEQPASPSQVGAAIARALQLSEPAGRP